MSPVRSRKSWTQRKIPRSQGCSRETSPNRIGLARSSRIPRPSMSQGCSRNTSCESSRDTSPARGFPPLDRFGLGQAGRIPGSVNAMRVLSTSTDLEAAVADALVRVAVCAVSLTYSATVFSVLPENRLQIRVLNHPGHSVKLCKYWVN